MKITIVGAGNAGTAHAAKFTELGHDVTILKTSNFSNHNYNAIHAEGYVEVGLERFRVKTTRSVKPAVVDAEVIFVLTRTDCHEKIIKLLSIYLKDGQHVVFTPGYCSSAIIAKKLKYFTKSLWIEGESLPWDARITLPGRVKILSTNVRNPIAAFPSSRNQEAIDFMLQILPNYFLRENIIESALHNPNLIAHTVGAIMSIGRIEYSLGQFYMYKEAFTPSIMKLIDALDGEKLAILRVLNLPQQTFEESFRFRNYETQEKICGVFDGYAPKGPKGPFNAQTRYITEDVPMGLELMQSLGEVCDVGTPICDALITIASEFCDLGDGRDIRNITGEWWNYPQDALEKMLRGELF